MKNTTRLMLIGQSLMMLALTIAALLFFGTVAAVVLALVFV